MAGSASGRASGGTSRHRRADVVQASLDDVAAPEPGFTSKQVEKIVGTSYRQLDYWARTDLLRPSLADARGSGTQRRYAYRDLVKLKVIKSLLDAGVRLETARKVVDTLREDHGTDWETASLVMNGSESVLTQSGDDLVDLVRRGQGVLNIVPLAPVVEELDARILELAPRSTDRAERSSDDVTAPRMTGGV
jgi:DNA-binding transcriptional MerR regulator